MEDIANEVLLGTGWFAEDDVTLVCPCGNSIEWDGDCPECGPSPLKGMGLI